MQGQRSAPVKWVRPLVAVGLLGGAVLFGVYQVGWMENARLREEIAKFERERAELVAFAERLSATQRVAQVDVVGQSHNGDGQPVITLRWQEIGREGLVSPPVDIQTIGELAYFEGLVLKFEFERVGSAAPTTAEDRRPATSLVMFRRVFGNLQTPESGASVDRGAPGMRENGPVPARMYEAGLWNRFWEFVDDPKLAEKYGVRVAQIEAPAVPVRPGEVFEVTLDAAGGLNVKKAGERPIEAEAVGDRSSGANGGDPRR